MENPSNVIGATASSYKNNSGNKSNDLYEYDDMDGGGGAGGGSRPGGGLADMGGKFKRMLTLDMDMDGGGGGSGYKRDCFDMMCAQINQTLLIPKAFYFFFFAAFGSLFPLMAIYFKQMAMTPMQVGVLLGLRPFVEFLSVPLWANISERMRKGKIILLVSMTCWILFTLTVGAIKPPVHSCLMHNETHVFNEMMGSRPLLIDKRHSPQPPSPPTVDESAALAVRRVKRQQQQQQQQGVVKVKGLNKIIKSKMASSSSSSSTARPTSAAYGVLSDDNSYDATGKENENESSNYDDAIDPVVVAVTTSTTPASLSKSTAKLNYFKVASPLDHAGVGKQQQQQQQQQHQQHDAAAGTDNKIIQLNGDVPLLVRPKLQTSIVYHKKDVERVFWIFLFFILAGEFFSAPAITLGRFSNAL